MFKFLRSLCRKFGRGGSGLLFLDCQSLYLKDELESIWEYSIFFEKEGMSVFKRRK